jgi:hypothetical protein
MAPIEERVNHDLESAAETGSSLLDAAREKVKDVAESAKEKLGDAADWTRDKASDLGHQVAEKAADLGQQATRQARRARLGFWQAMEEKPLVVGAAVLALGLFIGLAIPSTDPEDELMGDARDRLLDNVKEAGHQALDPNHSVA